MRRQTLFMSWTLLSIGCGEVQRANLDAGEILSVSQYEEAMLVEQLAFARAMERDARRLGIERGVDDKVSRIREKQHESNPCLNTEVQWTGLRCAAAIRRQLAVAAIELEELKRGSMATDRLTKLRSSIFQTIAHLEAVTGKIVHSVNE